MGRKQKKFLILVKVFIFLTFNFFLLLNFFYTLNSTNLPPSISASTVFLIMNFYSDLIKSSPSFYKNVLIPARLILFAR